MKAHENYSEEKNEEFKSNVINENIEVLLNKNESFNPVMKNLDDDNLKKLDFSGYQIPTSLPKETHYSFHHNKQITSQNQTISPSEANVVHQSSENLHEVDTTNTQNLQENLVSNEQQNVVNDVLSENFYQELKDSSLQENCEVENTNNRITEEISRFESSDMIIEAHNIDNRHIENTYENQNENAYAEGQANLSEENIVNPVSVAPPPPPPVRAGPPPPNRNPNILNKNKGKPKPRPTHIVSFGNFFDGNSNKNEGSQSNTVTTKNELMNEELFVQENQDVSKEQKNSESTINEFEKNNFRDSSKDKKVINSNYEQNFSNNEDPNAGFFNDYS